MTPIILKIHAPFPYLGVITAHLQNKHFDHTMWTTLHQVKCYKHTQYSYMLGKLKCKHDNVVTKASYNTIWTMKFMASMLPMGEKIAAVSGVCNREKKMTAYFCCWTKETVSIQLQRSCRQCILQKLFSIPKAEQFHICQTVTAWIVNVEVFDITLVW